MYEPFFASFSTTGPPGWPKPVSRPKWSRQFPIAMSNVSPNILYLPLSYAITWLFPPLTYKDTGFKAPVSSFPTSTWPIQWFTPIIGLESESARLLAAVATILNAGPRPGPCENEIKSISLYERPASLTACLINLGIHSAWCSAANLGWIPPSSGNSWFPAIERIFPLSSTIPTPVFSAVPSIPKHIITYNIKFFK